MVHFAFEGFGANFAASRRHSSEDASIVFTSCDECSSVVLVPDFQQPRAAPTQGVVSCTFYFMDIMAAKMK